jgi:hypothetical protein
MEHRHYIGKISLVICDEKHIGVRKVADDFGSVDLEFIESAIPPMRQQSEDQYQPPFQEQYMPEWIAFK